jgi:RNA polymerase-binding transcription factor DksA
MDGQLAAQVLTAGQTETLARIASMAADLHAIASASSGSNIDDEHDPEGSTIAFERAQLTALLTRAQSHLTDVDAALGRLSRLEYGICERCGNRIADDRLTALPAVRVCIRCAAR